MPGRVLTVARKLQDAWVALDVPQCGYCQAGQLLALGPQPVTVSEQHDGLWFALVDPYHGLRIESRWQAQTSGVATVEQSVTVAEVTNVAAASNVAAAPSVAEATPPLQLQRFASLVLPLPRWVRKNWITRPLGAQVGASSCHESVR